LTLTKKDKCSTYTRVTKENSSYEHFKHPSLSGLFTVLTIQPVYSSVTMVLALQAKRPHDAEDIINCQHPQSLTFIIPKTPQVVVIGPRRLTLSVIERKLILLLETIRI
jgi:hypothetical protein